MDVKTIEHNYSEVRKALKEKYFRQTDIMISAESFAFKKNADPLRDKKFWILKTAALLYPDCNVEKVLLPYGYTKEDIKTIERVLVSTEKKNISRMNIGETLYHEVYSH